MNWPPSEKQSFMTNWNTTHSVNFPPPSGSYSADLFSSYLLPPPVQGDLQQERKMAQDFINSYVSEKTNQKVLTKSDMPIKIYEAKQYFLDLMKLRKEIDMLLADLSGNDFEFNAKWEIIATKKCQIDNILSKFNSTVIQSLKKALAKRKIKRVRNQKKRSRLREEKKHEIEEKNRIIDKLLSEKSEEVEAVKREETLKRQADAVLHEVTKKKFEAKKMLHMLTALSKLRELRSQHEIERGGYCSKEVTETFNSVLTHFQEMWKKQLDMYQLEEKGLKVMLEESALPHIKQSKFKAILHQWELALFGSELTSENHPVLTQADASLDSFIQVRREWDQYIANPTDILSSNIPPGWVLPPDGNDEWKNFIKIKKKSNF